VKNLYADIPRNAAEEQLVEILARPGVRIERIVSHGHASPPGHWYDQAQAEWVAVLQGEAGIRFEDEAQAVTLRAGDFLDIAAHRRHRVEWTQAGAPTVWLAVFHD
jgi:cupin 2 domain-containing protein